MNMRLWKGLLIAIAILALAASLPLAGCAKKVASTPPDMSQAGSEGTYSTSSPAAPAPDYGQGSSGAISEGSAGDAARKAEAQAVAQFNTQDIHFAFDKSDLSPTAQDILKAKASFLRQYPNRNVMIEGHCDERGSSDYNLALGDRRANSARNFLVDLGINPKRISTVSYGEEQPKAMGHDEASWAENRRCHFVLE